MIPKVTITPSQERVYRDYKNNELKESERKIMAYLIEQIDNRDYVVEERKFNVGMNVLYQHQGQTGEGKVFAMKENNFSGGFGIFIRIGERLVEFKQRELILIGNER